MSSALERSEPENEPAGVTSNPKAVAGVSLVLPAVRAPATANPKRRAAPRLGLRWIVPGIAAAVLAAALLFAGATWERDSQSVLVGEVEARLVLEARHLALVSTGALLDPYPELTLQPVVLNMLRERPDLESAVVLDRAGLVQGHPQAAALRQPHTGQAGLAPIASRARLNEGETLEGDAQRLVAVAPVRVPSGERIGTAIVTMRRAWVAALADEARARRLVVTAVWLGGGTLAMLLVIAFLLRPVTALRHGIERLGRGDLETPIALRDRTEFGMLAETLDHMAAELRVAQRLAIEKDRLARELELARNLQRSLLPASRHEAGEFVLVGAQEAATEVGGDYFDVVPLENGHVGFAIADVSGKGIGGCLIMTMLSALLRGLRDRYESPAALLVAIDKSLRGSLPKAGFVTMTYGTLDPRTGSLALASAGHLPAMVFRAATHSVEWHRAKAVPLGALRKGGIETMLADESLTLGPGDLLVQVTDGYSEAPGEQGEMFDLTRIEATVRRHGPDGAEAVIRGLDEAVRAWAPGAARDDQTILVVGRQGGVAAAPPVVTEEPLAEPLALLARVEREGGRLTLQPQLADLARIRGWLREQATARALDPNAERIIVSALYETCANAIEHGLVGRRPAPVEVWWVPANGSARAGEREVFVVRDRGTPFDLSAPRASLDSATLRKRRRGLGVEMIQRFTTRIRYSGGTPEGNVAVLEFDPQRLRDTEGGPTDASAVRAG